MASVDDQNVNMNFNYSFKALTGHILDNHKETLYQ